MWSSKKYQRAAEKHYKTCKHLLDSIDTVKADVKPQVISNIFYLSGYILECILKFYILEEKHKTKSYSKEELTQLELWTHDIKGLWEKIANESPFWKKRTPKESPFDANGFEWTDLSKKWTEAVRYETDDKDYKNEKIVKKHFTQTVEPIFLKIKDKH
ncbi:hypothetical protein [Flectobacillus longus]|uniref:hypothetical protein n=1 Tax=Flectobacillus longus TaxID=2984207 RepID=UPI0024B65FCC|nr:hypothetical protein [Flectobacillus longus]MDI9882056.1 hypothetical protein [Flectobacillus longus]